MLVLASAEYALRGVGRLFRGTHAVRLSLCRLTHGSSSSNAVSVMNDAATVLPWMPHSAHALLTLAAASV